MTTNSIDLSYLQLKTNDLKKYPKAVFNQIEKDIKIGNKTWNTTKREKKFDDFYIEQNEDKHRKYNNWTVGYNLSGRRVIVLSVTKTIGKWEELEFELKTKNTTITHLYCVETITHDKAFIFDSFLDFFDTITVNITDIKLPPPTKNKF